MIAISCAPRGQAHRSGLEALVEEVVFQGNQRGFVCGLDGVGAEESKPLNNTGGVVIVAPPQFLRHRLGRSWMRRQECVDPCDVCVVARLSYNRADGDPPWGNELAIPASIRCERNLAASLICAAQRRDLRLLELRPGNIPKPGNGASREAGNGLACNDVLVGELPASQRMTEGGDCGGVIAERRAGQDMLHGLSRVLLSKTSHQEPTSMPCAP